MTTEIYDPNSIIAGDFPLMHRTVTIASGQDLKRGAVLGRVTADDEYIVSLSAAGDGSDVPKAILAHDVDTTAGDVVAPAYFTGEFAGEMLTYGTGHDAASVEAAFRQSDTSIFIRSIGAVA